MHTRSLKRLYKVTEAQLNDLEAGMTKTSALAHDHSPELGLPVPEPAEAAADAWARDMKELHDQA